ncbi:hypothetical protein Bca101_053266 [Brassica carinata]
MMILLTEKQSNLIPPGFEMGKPVTARWKKRSFSQKFYVILNGSYNSLEMQIIIRTEEAYCKNKIIII